MAKVPAVLFYTSDFLVGTMEMTMEERGQFITLLCLQHQKGHLAEKALKACVANPSPEVLKKFEQDENGQYFNRRMEAEILRRNAYTKSRWQNRVAASASSGKGICETYDTSYDATYDTTYDKTYDATYEKHMENENENETETEKETEKENESGSGRGCPFGRIRALYHELCTSFPKIRFIGGARERAVAARWRGSVGMDAFREVFSLAEASDFLKGKNERGWRADFDWMMKEDNFQKILEHKYDNREDAGGQSGYFADPGAYENMKPL